MKQLTAGDMQVVQLSERHFIRTCSSVFRMHFLVHAVLTLSFKHGDLAANIELAMTCSGLNTIFPVYVGHEGCISILHAFHFLHFSLPDTN